MRALKTVVVLTALAVATPAWAGWVIDETTKGASDDKSRQRMFLQSNRLKAVTYEGTRATEAMVMDLDAQTITQIDYKDRIYVTATAREFGEFLKQGLSMAGEAFGTEMQAQMK